MYKLLITRWLLCACAHQSILPGGIENFSNGMLLTARLFSKSFEIYGVWLDAGIRFFFIISINNTRAELFIAKVNHAVVSLTDKRHLFDEIKRPICQKHTAMDLLVPLSLS